LILNFNVNVQIKEQEVRRFVKVDRLECELIVSVFRAQISNASKCLEIYKQLNLIIL